MSKIRTVTNAQLFLDNDFGWRLQEISDIKTSIRSLEGAKSRTLIRAGVALLYAHWEGFVKNASQVYLEFVASQKLTYQELKICFIVFGLKKELDLIANSKRHAKNAKVIEFITNELGNRANLSYNDAIDTESNLSSTVFQGIIESLGIDSTPYETKFNLIDESLLSRRNRIAHGEFLDIGPNDYAGLSDEVVALMRSYKNNIENCLVLKSYMSVAAAQQSIAPDCL